MYMCVWCVEDPGVFRVKLRWKSCTVTLSWLNETLMIKDNLRSTPNAVTYALPPQAWSHFSFQCVLPKKSRKIMSVWHFPFPLFLLCLVLSHHEGYVGQSCAVFQNKCYCCSCIICRWEKRRNETIHQSVFYLLERQKTAKSSAERKQTTHCFSLFFLYVPEATAVINQIQDREDLPHQHRRERGECQEEQIQRYTAL